MVLSGKWNRVIKVFFNLDKHLSMLFVFRSNTTPHSHLQTLFLHLFNSHILPREQSKLVCIDKGRRISVAKRKQIKNLEMGRIGDEIHFVLLSCMCVILYYLFNSPYTCSPSLQTLMKTILHPPRPLFSSIVAPIHNIEELN